MDEGDFASLCCCLLEELMDLFELSPLADDLFPPAGAAAYEAPLSADERFYRALPLLLSLDLSKFTTLSA